MLRKLLLVSMMVVTITVGCGAQEPETTTYTNSELGYSITLIDPYSVIKEEDNGNYVEIGTSEGRLIEIMGLDDPPSTELDVLLDRLNTIYSKKMPEYELLYRSDLKLDSGETARIQGLRGKVPNDPANCIRIRYTLSIIHKGRALFLMGMPCEDGEKDGETMINSLSLSH